MYTSFAEVRRAAPGIHVFKLIGGGGAFEVSILTPQKNDAEHDDKRVSAQCTIGDGTRKNPYTYEIVADVSPHYAIIDLWYRFRELTKLEHARLIFIEVNDWVLQVGPDGVTSEDGHFTKLI